MERSLRFVSEERRKITTGSVEYDSSKTTHCTLSNIMSTGICIFLMQTQWLEMLKCCLQKSNLPHMQLSVILTIPIEQISMVFAIKVVNEAIDDINALKSVAELDQGLVIVDPTTTKEGTIAVMTHIAGEMKTTTTGEVIIEMESTTTKGAMTTKETQIVAEMENIKETTPKEIKTAFCSPGGWDLRKLSKVVRPEKIVQGSSI